MIGISTSNILLSRRLRGWAGRLSGAQRGTSSTVLGVDLSLLGPPTRLFTGAGLAHRPCLCPEMRVEVVGGGRRGVLPEVSIADEGELGVGSSGSAR